MISSTTRGTELPRFLLFLVTSSAGWIIIGCGLFIGGLIWGLNSHQVSYIQGGQGVYQTFVTEDNAYIIFQQSDTDNYYVMHTPDYAPEVDTNTILNLMQPGSSFSFIASTDTVTIASMVKDTGQYIGHAHPIERVVFYDAKQQKSLTYTSSEYSGNPNGYTINNWPYASLLMLAGVLCTGASILFLARSRRRKKLAIAANLAALEAMPSPFARELAADTPQTRQPYQGIEQYPQTPSTSHISRPYQSPQE